MPSQLAQFFKDCRLQRKFTLGELSRIIGYRDAGKGAGRIHRFEENGAVHAVLLAKLTAVFDIDQAKVDALIEEDRRQFIREWLAWATEAIDPYVVVRMVPALYVTEVVPDAGATTLENAEVFAAKRARHWQKRCCLVWSRRHSVWFDEQGEVYDRTEALAGIPNTPYMRLGRSKSPFLVRSLSGPDFIRAVEWPERHEPVGQEEEKT
jgi:hypothetical protein